LVKNVIKNLGVHVGEVIKWLAWHMGDAIWWDCTVSFVCL